MIGRKMRVKAEAGRISGFTIMKEAKHIPELRYKD